MLITVELTMSIAHNVKAAERQCSRKPRVQLMPSPVSATAKLNKWNAVSSQGSTSLTLPRRSSETMKRGCVTSIILIPTRVSITAQASSGMVGCIPRLKPAALGSMEPSELNGRIKGPSTLVDDDMQMTCLERNQNYKRIGHKKTKRRQFCIKPMQTCNIKLKR